ncbi:MAG: pyruvate ferredoxin oxidoreductase, partial [Patescibacteria group bacterium]
MTANNKKNKLALTGGGAAAQALRQINPEVVAVYPITPQTTIIETFSKMKADGLVDTEVIQAESEHSALSACVGAAASGARTATATSSQGLALMHEVLYIASGMRLPILMLVSARALSAPINIHGDHSDVMGARDSGWIQLFAENVQEVYDLSFIGLKLAEKVKLPVMVIMDGFNTSHSVENLEILEDSRVRDFLGEYEAENSLLDIKRPMTFGPLALQNSYFEFKIDQAEAMERVFSEFPKIAREFSELSGRKYGFFEKYNFRDSEKAMVMIGSATGTAKDAVDDLEEKTGILKLTLFRPFPKRQVAETLKDKERIAVL